MDCGVGAQSRQGCKSCKHWLQIKMASWAARSSRALIQWCAGQEGRELTDVGSVLERLQQFLQQHWTSEAEHVVHEHQDAALRCRHGKLRTV